MERSGKKVFKLYKPSKGERVDTDDTNSKTRSKNGPTRGSVNNSNEIFYSNGYGNVVYNLPFGLTGE